MASPLSSGLRCRGPSCAKGPLFQGFLTVRSRCPVCGLGLSGQDSADGPVAFINLIVGGIVVALALIAEIRYAPPVWLHLLLWLPLAMILVVALMRPFRVLLIALQYQHRRHDFSERA